MYIDLWRAWGPPSGPRGLAGRFLNVSGHLLEHAKNLRLGDAGSWPGAFMEHPAGPLGPQDATQPTTDLCTHFTQDFLDFVLIEKIYFYILGGGAAPKDRLDKSFQKFENTLLQFQPQTLSGKSAG